MAVDMTPFDDPRVREAFRLIVDRQALINGAIAGFGTCRRTISSSQEPPVLRRNAPVREQDPREGEVRCSRRQGRRTSRSRLHTSDVVPGFVEAATLFAQQAKKSRASRST